MFVLEIPANEEVIVVVFDAVVVVVVVKKKKIIGWEAKAKIISKSFKGALKECSSNKRDPRTNISNSDPPSRRHSNISIYIPFRVPYLSLFQPFFVVRKKQTSFLNSLTKNVLSNTFLLAICG